MSYPTGQYLMSSVAEDESLPTALRIAVVRDKSYRPTAQSLAGVLLCIVTELQAHFRFDDDGARINQRLHAMWNALMPVLEIKKLYDKRYAQLMKDRHINP